MEKVLKKYLKKNVPDIRTGDTVKVSIIVKEGAKERIQAFEGLVIATKHGSTLDGTFTVRKESFGIGVERVFPLHSPRIVKVERIKQSKIRRSKLYYMRELSGKNARLKELNRDNKIWEEKGAEEELAKIESEKAAEAEAHAAAKAAEEAELAAKVEAVAGDRVVEKEEKE
ncbi:MAG: 50S ribosomal protein L19 [Candidatus Berkelbacteria bacterium]|nr:50S ribosomal protein L19 [Candidatus Berkelbacteria bacterium]